MQAMPLPLDAAGQLTEGVPSVQPARLEQAEGEANVKLRCWLGWHHWERQERDWKCLVCGKTVLSTTASLLSINDIAPSNVYEGWVYAQNGIPIDSATINLYATGTLAPVLMTTVSNHEGYWAFNTTGKFDVEIIVGSLVSRRKYWESSEEKPR